MGRLVGQCIARGQRLEDVGLDELRALAPQFDEGVEGITVRSSIDARDVPGGTASLRVELALAEARRLVGETRRWASDMRARLPSVEALTAFSSEARDITHLD